MKFRVGNRGSAARRSIMSLVLGTVAVVGVASGPDVDAASAPTSDASFQSGWQNVGDVINTGTPADGIDDLLVTMYANYPKNVMVGETFNFQVCATSVTATRFGGLSEYVGRVRWGVTSIFGTAMNFDLNWGGPPGGGPLVTAYDGGPATKSVSQCQTATGSLSSTGVYTYGIGNMTADVWECTDVSDPVYTPGVYGCNLWSSIVGGPWTRTNASTPNSRSTATINVFPALAAVNDTLGVPPLGAGTATILANDTVNPTTTVSIQTQGVNGTCNVTASRTIIYVHTGPGRPGE